MYHTNVGAKPIHKLSHITVYYFLLSSLTDINVQYNNKNNNFTCFLSFLTKFGPNGVR